MTKNSRYTTTLTFEIDDVAGPMSKSEKAEVNDFIIAALQSYGGSRSPADWLFGSLENIKLTAIKPVKSATRNRRDHATPRTTAP